MRGFEHTKDQYVTFTDEELEGLEAARTALELFEFVPADTIDAHFIEKSYFIGPDKGGDRAYRLIATALQRRGLVGVGRFAARGRDLLVILRPYRSGILLHECFYADEVRSFDDVETGATFEFKEIELEVVDKLIDQLARDAFEPARFKDEWAEKVLAAVNQKKVACEEVTAAPEAPKAQIIDLLAALKRSVAANAERIRELTPATRVKPSPDSDVKIAKKRKPSRPGTIHVLHPERN